LTRLILGEPSIASRKYKSCFVHREEVVFFPNNSQKFKSTLRTLPNRTLPNYPFQITQVNMLFTSYLLAFSSVAFAAAAQQASAATGENFHVPCMAPSLKEYFDFANLPDQL
jgi:hypothetical protein